MGFPPPGVNNNHNDAGDEPRLVISANRSIREPDVLLFAWSTGHSTSKVAPPMGKGARIRKEREEKKLLAGWRHAVVSQGDSSLQVFLHRRGFPLPLSRHILDNSRKVMRLLDGD